MTAKELRQKFLDFMKSKGHTIIPSASLVPENDASTLFTTAGMHPLVPYFLGEKHPGGTRVANVQKCVRTGDIDDVGDNRHNTFFEMMGNWSFGDYFKKEAIEWSFEFLTGKEWLGLDPKRFYVTVFKGEQGIPRDEEAIEIWKKVFEKNGMKAEVVGEDEMIKNDVRIIPLGVDDNFWIAGATGPCGGDTEMFYDVRPEEGKLEGKFSDLVNSFRILEVWNDVFMEFNKKIKGEKKEEASQFEMEGRNIPEEFYQYEKLAKRNVDTGMGLERIMAVLNKKENIFETELFQSIIVETEEISGKKYQNDFKSFRIIVDHIRASVFLIADGVSPSNTDRGYILRRLIRRAVRYGKMLGIEQNFLRKLAEVVIEKYGDFYRELKENQDRIFEELEKEESKFRKTLERGERIIETSPSPSPSESESESIAEELFILKTQEGLPLEVSLEKMKAKGFEIDDEVVSIYREKIKKHQDLSRTASAGKFKGGLADASVETTKLHTAAHLLLAALREVLGSDIFQKGSNITAERLRFDFNYPQKMTEEQIKKVEDLVNQKIQEKLEVEMVEMPKEEALKIAKISFDPAKYGDVVKVYRIGDPAKGGQAFSVELCGGPHVKNTGELGHFKITKEESSSSGVRRIKAILGQRDNLI